MYLARTVLVGRGGHIGYLAGSLSALALGFGTSAAYPAAIAMVRRQSQRLHVPTPSSVLCALVIAGQVNVAVGPSLWLLIAAYGSRFSSTCSWRWLGWCRHFWFALL